MTGRFRLTLVLFVALTLHLSLFAGIHIGDAHPQVMLLASVAAGLLAGSERGALIGFVAGLLADLFVQTPLGLSALTYALVGFSVGTVQSAMIRSAWWIAPATALLASFAGVLLYGLLGAIIGQSHFVSPRLLIVAGWVAVMNGLLAVPVARAMGWALAAEPESAFAR
ncbi:MAG: rod shape-determining protein MreD [Acidimicrobiales bacterium]